MSARTFHWLSMGGGGHVPPLLAVDHLPSHPPEIDKNAFAGKASQIQSLEIRDIAMTLAQQFHQEGRKERLWIGKIQTLEEFLDLPLSPRELLDGWTLEELEVAHERLRATYENRFKRS